MNFFYQVLIILNCFTICLTTSKLLEISNIIKNAINESVDPCEDFYEFSCGQWISNNEMQSNSFVNETYLKLKGKLNTFC